MMNLCIGEFYSNIYSISIENVSNYLEDHFLRNLIYKTPLKDRQGLDWKINNFILVSITSMLAIFCLIHSKFKAIGK